MEYIFSLRSAMREALRTKIRDMGNIPIARSERFACLVALWDLP